MKQHITVEQLDELTEEQLNKVLIQEWGMATAIRHAKDEICRRCFSIGKMIEILIENNGIETHYDSRITLINKADIELGWEGMYEGEELCDALWEAVKAIL